LQVAGAIINSGDLSVTVCRTIFFKFLIENKALVTEIQVKKFGTATP
jgi:hypothetical protein